MSDLLTLKLFKNRIIYDRSDNWKDYIDNDTNGIKYPNDEITIELSDCLISCSKENYDNISHKNHHLIHNGCDYKVYDTTKKQKIAIYIGYNGFKFDFDKLNTLANKNMDWTFHILVKKNIDKLNYSKNILFSDFTSDELTLDRLLESSSIGLILFKDNKWAKAMDPLKIYQYINAKIPIIYNGITMENFKDVSYRYSKDLNMDNINLDTDLFNKYQKEISWNNYLNKITDLIKIEQEALNIDYENTNCN